MSQVTITLPTATAIGVGHSLRALAANGYPNASTAEVFADIGTILVDAATDAIKASIVARSLPRKRGHGGLI
jgi:hypothetical protein